MSRKFLTPVLLPADPVNALEAATKQYVDRTWKNFTVGSVVQGVSLTFSVFRARYCQIGYLVSGTCAINLTSAGTNGQNITLNATGLPAPAAAMQGIGAGRYYRPAGYVGVFPYVNAAGTVWGFEPSSGTGFLGAAFAAANGDNLYFSFTYETTVAPTGVDATMSQEG